MKKIYNHFFSGILPLLTLVVLLIEPVSVKSQCGVSSTGNSAMPTACADGTLSLGPGETRTITGVTSGERIEILYTAPSLGASFYVANTACVGGSPFGTTYQFTAGGTTFTLGTSRNGNPGALWAGWGNASYSAVLTYRRITPTLAANTPTSATFCNGGSQTITPATASNGTAVWQGTTSNGTATTPPGAQTVSAAGTYYFRPNNNGCFGAQQSTVVTVVADPTVSISGAAEVCEGGTVNLTANVSGGTGTVSGYQWRRNSSNVATGGPGYTTSNALSAGSYSYDVSVTQTGSGCASTFSTAVNANVVADPTVSISGAATACEGGTVNLTANVSGGSGAVSGYQWRRNGSNVATGGPGYTTSNALSAGTYSYDVSVTTAGNGCASAFSAAVNANVVADPTVSITGAATACEGGTVDLTANVSGGTGTVSGYQWRRNGSNVATGGPGYTTSNALSAGSYSYDVSVTQTGSGCASTFSTAVNANVVADPTVSISGAATACEGGTVSLTANVSGGSGAVSGYQWRRNSSNVATGGPGYTTSNALAAGTYTYDVSVTQTGSGCASAFSTAVNANVVADPTVSISGAAEVCEGGTVDLTANVSGGTGTVSGYQWRRNGSNVATGGPGYTTSNALAAGTYTYDVSVTQTGSGCASAFSTAVNANVVLDIAITTQPSNASICKGGTNSFSLVAANGTPSLSYQWEYNNGGTWGGVTDGIPVGVTYPGGGGSASLSVNTTGSTNAATYQYRCIVSAAGNGCGPATSNVVTLTVNELPSVNSQPSSANVCEGSTVSFSTTGGGGVVLSYQWEYFNGTSWNGVTDGAPSGSTYTNGNTSSVNISGLSGGGGSSSYLYRCVISSTGSGCGSINTNNVTASVHTVPTVTNNSASLCEGSSKNLTTNLDATSGVTWAVTPGCVGCITGGPSPTAYVFNAPNPGGASANYTITARNANNASCNTFYIQTVYQQDPSNAGADDTKCNSGSFNLSANIPNFGTGQWACMSGCAGVNINSPSSNTSTVSNVPYGTTQLRWRVTNGSCISDDFVNLTNDQPYTITSSNADMCEFSNRTLVASLGGGTFYASCGPCVSGNTFTAPNVTGVSQNISIGYHLNSCPDPSQTITVYNGPQPSVDAGPDQNVCGTSADLAATQLTVGSGVWTVQAGSGTFTPANTNFDASINSLANGSNTLRWTATNGACTSFDEVEVKANTVTTAIPHAVGTFTATRECLDVASGYTHYFDNGTDATANTADDRRILSLKKNGNNIGTVGVGGFNVKVTLDPNYGSNGYKIGLPGATYVQNNVNTWAVMARWWDVVPTTQPGSDVEVQFYFDETDYQDVLNMAASQGWEPIQVPYLDLQFYKMIGNINPSPATGHPGVTPTDVQIYDVNAYHPNVKQWTYSTFGSDHAARFAVTSFSGGGGGFGGGGQGALPVELLYLTATAIDNNYISVDWATVLEINNAGFEVQRSTDAQNWNTISWIAGNNNSTVQHTYQYKDQNVQKGIVYYYRLKQIDNDSHYEYTKIVSAILNGKNTFTVLDFVPNPTLDQTSLLITANAGTEITVEFYSGIGEKMSSGKYVLNVGVNTIPFVVHQLAAGTYTAIVTNGNEVYSKKLIVTR